MMYQLKYTSGYELHVIGSGDSGLCRVYRGETEVHHGTYDECYRWLRNRACFPITPSVEACDEFFRRDDMQPERIA